MAFFDFTGISQTGSVAYTFTGGTTNPGITFTFSFSGGGFASTGSFNGDDITAFDGSDIFWNANISFTLNSTLTVNSVAFSTSLAGGATTIRSDVPLGGGTNLVRFTISGQGGTLNITSFDASCFLTGTRIATPKGEVAVEDLVAGDAVLTADGDETTVQWLGRQEMDTKLQHPYKINPICISAGSLAAGVPQRDLYLSADHAVALDGLLINAGALVNGRTIYQVVQMPREGFTYFHVETDTHEVILAEGTAAESYLDSMERSDFDNGAERADAPPIQELALPRISSARLLPAPIRARLEARADALAGPVRLAG